MPIYEYTCVCGHEREVIVLKPTNELRIPCPKCTAMMTRKPSVVHGRVGGLTPLSPQGESHVSRAIERVRHAERDKKL
jgi:hypothetical protein